MFFNLFRKRQETIFQADKLRKGFSKSNVFFFFSNLVYSRSLDRYPLIDVLWGPHEEYC